MMKAAIQNTKKRLTQVSIFLDKISRYTPPTNQGWAEKEEGINDESSHLKHKIKKIQVYIMKRKLSRYTPPTSQGCVEKEEGSNDESSHSKHKKKTDTSFNLHRETFKVHTTH